MQSLQAIGFTEYEARAYVALVGQPDLNGYEVAKRTGIPRANIYPVLDKLVRRGALLRVERSDGPRYTAVDPERLLSGLAAEHRRALGEARRDLASIARHAEPPSVFNLRGEEWLLQARRLIGDAAASLLVAIQPPQAAALAEPLRDARERGVSITTLCLESCPGNCGHCQGEVYCYRLQEGAGERWLVLVADDRQTLVARFREQAREEAVLTAQPLVVRLASAYIQQSLTLATLGGELAADFEGLLSAETRRRLDGFCPQGDFVGWLKGVTAHTG